jgi:hypothetical protein
MSSTDRGFLPHCSYNCSRSLFPSLSLSLSLPEVPPCRPCGSHQSRSSIGRADARIQQTSPSPSPPIPDTDTEPEPEPEPSEYAEEPVREQLARNDAFLREDGVSPVPAASVVIVGGGGSWAAVMVARSGIAKLHLVDFDYVTLSSITLARPRYCASPRAIAPFVQVDPRMELRRGDEDGAKLLRVADWVIGVFIICNVLLRLLAWPLGR